MIASKYLRGKPPVPQISQVGSGIQILVKGTEISNPKLDSEVELIDTMTALTPSLDISLHWE